MLRKKQSDNKYLKIKTNLELPKINLEKLQYYSIITKMTMTKLGI